jgi:hypothetical protein
MNGADGRGVPSGSGTLADTGSWAGWEHYVPQFVHPVKVAVVETLLHIGEPLSTTQFTKLFSGEGEGFRESNIRYHLRHLVKVGVLEVVTSGPSSDLSPAEKFFTLVTLSTFSGSTYVQQPERN